MFLGLVSYVYITDLSLSPAPSLGQTFESLLN